VNGDASAKPAAEVYVVLSDEGESFDVRGVYSTRELAEAAVAAIRDCDGGNFNAAGEVTPRRRDCDLEIKAYVLDEVPPSVSAWCAVAWTNKCGEIEGYVQARPQPEEKRSSDIVAWEWDGRTEWRAVGYGQTREQAVRRAIELWRACTASDAAKAATTWRRT